ncbi:MAG: hypothetical protein M3Z75_03810 [Actinomycetota bacterium]|nr:hypothetical protein [Actinomycetota bacterium]
MVCYARPAGWLAALLIGALLVFSEPAGHFLGTAAWVVAATVATGGAAIAAALVFAAFMSTRRRRASAGGCVSCQFRCQHAMTGSSRRPWLVTTADRRGHPPVPGPGPMLLPGPAVRPAGLPAGTPRWPDQPLQRAPGQQERAGSAA